MNLQTIQKRLEELQAELLTVSNDLAHLIAGDVVRPRPSIDPKGGVIYSRHQLQVGDRFIVEEYSVFVNQGTYTVVEVEGEDYDGVLSVMVRNGNGNSEWIQFETLTAPRFA
jgi:hypothetical protein